MEQYRLQAIDLTKIFDDGKKGPVTAIDHVNLEVKEGEFVMIVGPSGCGKTPLLNILGGTGTGCRPGNGIPGLQPVSVAYRSKKRGIRTEDEKNAKGRARDAGKEVYRSGGAHRV